MLETIRCNCSTPTPYLKEWLPKLDLPKDSRIVDLGCGNGRNSKHIINCGFKNIKSFDLRGDYGAEANLLNGIPLHNKSADFIVCNYLLCFMNNRERSFMAREIERIAAWNCYLMVELYNGKNAKPYVTEKVAELFQYWNVIHIVKDRFILQRGR